MKIRELREAAGLTQADVVRAFGVDAAAVARWESGKAMPRADKLPKLAEMFDCTIDALYGREPPKQAKSLPNRERSVFRYEI